MPQDDGAAGPRAITSGAPPLAGDGLDRAPARVGDPRAVRRPGRLGRRVSPPGIDGVRSPPPGAATVCSELESNVAVREHDRGSRPG